MTTRPVRRLPLTSRRRGLTLVEAALSLLILSVLAAAALSAVSRARATRNAVDEQSMGESLARSMLGEVMALPYKEAASTAIGVEAGESTASRTTLDDVDDYNLLAETPCTTRSGTVIAGTDAWQRSVIVSWVPVTDTATGTGVDTGLKRIWVVVKHNGKLVTRASVLRSQAWDDMLASGGM